MANGLPNPNTAQDDLDQDSQPQVPDLAKLLALAYPGSRAEAETPYGQAQAAQRAQQAARDQSFLNAIQAKKNKDILTPPTYESFPTQDSAGNYSIQKQLTPEAATQQAMEWGKILSPANAAAAQGTGAAEINRAADAQSMQALQQLLGGNKLPGGTHIQAGRGIGITTPSLNQTIPPNVQKAIDDLEKQRPKTLPFGFENPFASSKNADIDRKINSIKAQYGIAPTAPNASQAAPTVPSANRLTRPLKSGGTAYSDDGGQTWYTDSQ